MRNTFTITLSIGLTLAVLIGPGFAAKKTSSAKSGLGDNLGVSGQSVTIFAPDPKLQGRFLFKIWARGISLKSVGGTSTGALSGVTAYLFQKGVSAARLTAPMARADSASQTVVAVGRVHVESQTERGTTLDADTVFWHARTNIIEATGNVLYRNGKNGVTLRGPHFIANTALQTINSAGPGRATFH